MNFSIDNRFQRESIISSISSSISNDSINSQLSNRKQRLKKKNFCFEDFLFFGPLILFLILLISGIILFIIIQQQTYKNQNNEFEFNEQFSNENFLPILCSFTSSSQTIFVFNQLKCSRNRSSIFHIYYSNNRNLIKQGDYLTREDVINQPKIQLDYKFLSKFYTKSFILILIDPQHLRYYADTATLHWIRYYSSSLDNEEDICCYKFMDYMPLNNSQRIILLYATNSSQMMIKAKTICHVPSDWFQLDKYIYFLKLKLVASINFFMKYIDDGDD